MREKYKTKLEVVDELECARGLYRLLENKIVLKRTFPHPNREYESEPIRILKNLNPEYWSKLREIVTEILYEPYKLNDYESRLRITKEFHKIANKILSYLGYEIKAQENYRDHLERISYTLKRIGRLLYMEPKDIMDYRKSYWQI